MQQLCMSARDGSVLAVFLALLLNTNSGVSQVQTYADGLTVVTVMPGREQILNQVHTE